MSAIVDKHKPQRFSKVVGNGFNRRTVFCVEEIDFNALLVDAEILEGLLDRAVKYIQQSADHPASDGSEYELLGRIELALNKAL